MKNTGYYVDFKGFKIVVTAEFIKLARVVGTKEYNDFKQLQTDYPNLKIKYAPKVNKNKNTHKGLTIEFMERYIENSDNRDLIINGFKKMKAIYKGHPAYYAKMKKYFLSNFSDLTMRDIEMHIESEEDMDESLNKEEAEKAIENNISQAAAKVSPTEIELAVAG